MKTCEFCGGSGKLIVDMHEDNCAIPIRGLQVCDRCNGAGRVEAVGRHTSLRLECSVGEGDSVSFYGPNADPASLVSVRVKDEDGEATIYLDAASESRLLAWLKAREEERHG